ncbi:MAG TPA: LytR C-terminal domain-containing protein [Gemmatimonadales bacterium]
MALVGAAAWLVIGGADAVPAALPIPGVRDTIAVEVLNTTVVDGLAREATRRLRRAGLDVVSVGSDRGAAVDSTLILVRRGDLASGERVRLALGLGQVMMVPDPRLLLDVSVLLGPDAAGAIRRDP